jgi:phosphatidate cytidylyltransferase
MLLIVVGALFWSKWSAGALFAVLMLGGLVEFYRLCKKRGFSPMYIVGIAMAAAIFVPAFMAFMLWESSEPADKFSAMRAIVGVAAALVLALPMAFIVELWRKKPTPIANIATTFAGVVYVAMPMVLMFTISFYLVDKWNPWAILAFISIVWVNDVFAYLVGVMFGKHRLCERISPKKSLEGFAGGLAGAIGVSLLYGHLFEGNILIWGGLGLIVALTGVAGDFAESLMKREAEVKDSGNIMPGHGGFLDRFDALYMSVPFAFVYLVIISEIVKP